MGNQAGLCRQQHVTFRVTNEKRPPLN